MSSSSEVEEDSFSNLDSDFETEDELDGELLGAQPYMFEPVVSESDDEDHDEVERDAAFEEGDVEGRLGNNNWCSCRGGCSAMPTLRESRCCKEIDQIVTKMDEDQELNLDCITEHPGFEPVCMNKYVLETAYYQYRQQYGEQARQDATENQKCRHVAYRQLVRWCWGFLGRRVRVPLPSCAVRRIRDAFPSEEFRGFEEA